MLSVVATEQIAVRLPHELLQAVDHLVSEGRFDSRAAAVRAGIESVLEVERRRELDRAIVEGYRRIPSTVVGTQGALASLRDAIGEEPW